MINLSRVYLKESKEREIQHCLCFQFVLCLEEQLIIKNKKIHLKNQAKLSISNLIRNLKLFFTLCTDV